MGIINENNNPLQSESRNRKKKGFYEKVTYGGTNSRAFTALSKNEYSHKKDKESKSFNKYEVFEFHTKTRLERKQNKPRKPKIYKIITFINLYENTI